MKIKDLNLNPEELELDLTTVMTNNITFDYLTLLAQFKNSGYLEVSYKVNAKDATMAIKTLNELKPEITSILDKHFYTYTSSTQNEFSVYSEPGLQSFIIGISYRIKDK